MPEGAILFDRSYFDKPEWLNQSSEKPGFSRGPAWLDLLALTNQKATTGFVRGINIPLERGHCAYSKLGLANRWGRSQGWVSATLTMWEKDGRVKMLKSDNETTIIEVSNFDSWQVALSEMTATKVRASSDQVGTEKEKEKDMNKTPRGEGKGSGGRVADFPELPSDEVLMAFGKAFVGDPISGAPRMPDDWLEDIIVRLTGRRDLPRDWRRFMVAMWRREFRTWTGVKNAGVSANVQAITEQNQTRTLKAELTALEDEILADRLTNLPRDAEKMARVKKLREQVAVREVTK